MDSWILRWSVRRERVLWRLQTDCAMWGLRCATCLFYRLFPDYIEVAVRYKVLDKRSCAKQRQIYSGLTISLLWSAPEPTVTTSTSPIPSSIKYVRISGLLCKIDVSARSGPASGKTNARMNPVQGYRHLLSILFAVHAGFHDFPPFRRRIRLVVVDSPCPEFHSYVDNFDTTIINGSFAHVPYLKQFKVICKRIQARLFNGFNGWRCCEGNSKEPSARQNHMRCRQIT
jgi:hypothetical protein